MATKSKSKTVSRSYLNKVKTELPRPQKNWLDAAERVDAYEQGLQDYGIDPEAVYSDYRDWMGLDEGEVEALAAADENVGFVARGHKPRASVPEDSFFDEDGNDEYQRRVQDHLAKKNKATKKKGKKKS